MKQFMYFESTEGGMETSVFRGQNDLPYLYGWMSDHCQDADTAMVTWMETAEIGDVFDHRLGYLVRIKDETATYC